MQKLLTSTEQQVVSFIDSYINENHPRYSDWYIGIASKPTNRLFIDHKVDEQYGQWAYKDAGTNTAARIVEQFFIKELGTDGGPGGGDTTTKYVYAYKKTPTTIE